MKGNDRNAVAQTGDPNTIVQMKVSTAKQCLWKIMLHRNILMGPSIKIFKDSIQFSVSISLETHDTDYKNRLIQLMYINTVVCIKYYSICKFIINLLCLQASHLTIANRTPGKYEYQGCHNDDYEDMRFSHW
jgi:hypothetical protein